MTKKRRIVELYNFLKLARMSRMTDGERVAFCRLLRQMKPVATEVSEAVQDAIEKAREELKDEREVMAFADRAVDDLIGQDVDIAINTMTQEAFDHLTLSNDWTFAQIDELETELVAKEKDDN